MLVILEKMALLVIMLALGYLCVKLKLVGPEFNKGLNKLVINILLVGLILGSVINKDLGMSRSDMLFCLGMMTIMQVLCLVIGVLARRLPGLKNGDGGVYALLIAFSNLGFIGVPVIASVYGDSAVFLVSLGNIPFNILLYTVGILLLQDDGSRQKIDIKRMINVPIIATFAATVIFLFNIPMPTLIEDAANMLSDACVPLSMMCVGLSLGNVSLKKTIMNPRIYIVNFLRLIVCPLLVWLIMRVFVSDPVMLGSIVIVAACPPAVVCTIVAMENGRDGVESSELICLGTLLSMVTIPLLISVLGL